MMKAGEVRVALRKYFSHPEYAIAFEVAQATGFSARRHLDAVAMDLWPSRGLSLHGIEIKVNLYDWKREKKDPSKAEEIATFCDLFWVAAPKGLIPVDDIPEAWGLLEVMDRGLICQTKKAIKTPAKDGGRSFLAAMMRAAGRPMTRDDADDILSVERRRLEEGYEERVKKKAQSMLERNSRGSEHWNALVAAIGKDPDRFYESSELIAAVKVVMKAGVAESWKGVEYLHKILGESHDRLAEAMKMMHLDSTGRK